MSTGKGSRTKGDNLRWTSTSFKRSSNIPNRSFNGNRDKLQQFENTTFSKLLVLSLYVSFLNRAETKTVDRYRISRQGFFKSIQIILISSKNGPFRSFRCLRENL